MKNKKPEKPDPIPRNLSKLPEKDRIGYVSDVIGTFPNPNQFAVGMSKDSVTWCASKGILARLGEYDLLKSTNVGEFRLYHTAMAVLLLSQIDPLDGISTSRLKTATITQFHTATQKYYLSTNPNYVTQTYDRVFGELLQGGIIGTGRGTRAKKAFLENASPRDFLSLMYGKTLFHPVGKSSWKRAYLAGITTHHRGIDRTAIYDLSLALHGEELVRKTDPEKFIILHGPDGTGFVVFDIRGGLWRCYDRPEKPAALVLRDQDDKEREDISKALQVIAVMPFIGIKSLSKLFPERTVRVLSDIARHKANSLLVEYSNCFVEARHVNWLKLSQEGMLDYDLLTKSQGLWNRMVFARGNDTISDLLTETQEVLITLAENQRIRSDHSRLQGVVLKYLEEIGYASDQVGVPFHELVSENASLFLRFLRFTGVRL